MRTISDAHGHFVNSIALSATYPVLISGGVDKAVCIWSCA
jgi:WD40 repeat protein